MYEEALGAAAAAAAAVAAGACDAAAEEPALGFGTFASAMLLVSLVLL